MAKIMMLVLTRAAGFSPGIVEVEDSPKIRWLLKSDRFELIDPPCLSWLDSPEKADKPLEEEVEAANGISTSDYKAAATIEPSGPISRTRLREKSQKRSSEGQGNSTPS